MKIKTPPVDDMIAIINLHTQGITIATMPSGSKTASMEYGRRSVSIGEFFRNEDLVIRSAYLRLRDDMKRECFLVKKFKLKSLP